MAVTEVPRAYCGCAIEVPYCVLTESHFSQGKGTRAASLAWAALTVGLAVFCQFLTVHYNRHDNWTALFCTGQRASVPPQLIPATYRFANSTGYDGQMYRYIARDPFARLGYEKYLDAPVSRFRRILVPFLAFALAGGAEHWIDAAYIVVIAGFVLAGSYWLSRWAVIQSFGAAWGVAFLLAPATLISIDRMTVDVALAALTVGFVYYTAIGSTAGLYLVVFAACLTRETGVLLLAAVCIFELWSRRFTRALFWATACLPTIGWYLYLSNHLHVIKSVLAVPRWVAGERGWGVVFRILHPRRYELPPALEAVTRCLDVISLVGVVCAVVAAAILFLRAPSPFRLAGFLFAILAVLLTSPYFWDDPFSYARVFTPLLGLVGLAAVAGKSPPRRWGWAFVPMLLVDLRIGLQLGPEALGILHGMAGR